MSEQKVKSRAPRKIVYRGKSMSLNPQRAELYANDIQLVDTLCNIESGLTDWEVNFVEDVARKVHDRGEILRPDQRRKAEQILQERT